jgi:hypothetical protein
MINAGIAAFLKNLRNARSVRSAKADASAATLESLICEFVFGFDFCSDFIILSPCNV